MALFFGSQSGDQPHSAGVLLECVIILVINIVITSDARSKWLAGAKREQVNYAMKGFWYSGLMTRLRRTTAIIVSTVVAGRVGRRESWV